MSIFINEQEIRAMREHYKGRIENLEDEVKRLQKVIEAQDHLLICYRTGKLPAERRLKVLAGFREAEQAGKDSEQ
jgi:hypothetical protein